MHGTIRAAGRLTRASLAVGVAAAIFFVVTASPALAATAVSIHGLAYNPQTVSVPAGTTVTWTNMDAGTPHSVTSDTGAFDSSPSCSPSATSGCIQTGQTFSFTFNTPGTFSYHCRVHSFMTGTVTVQAVTMTTAAPPTTAPGSTATTAAPSSSPTTAAPASVSAAVATPTTLPTTGAAGTGRLALIAVLLTVTGLLLIGATRRHPQR